MRLFLITAFVLGSFGAITAAVASENNCPFQSIAQGRHCVLDQDIVLEAPLDLPAHTTLDCRGHKILPSVAGVPDNPATNAFDPVFSRPRLAVFLDGVQGTTVRNCVIDGDFDFGILAINSKVSERDKDDPDTLAKRRNQIFKNTVNALYVPVHLMAADNFEIKLNRISYFVRGGVAVLVDYDSDRNIVRYNSITSDLIAARAPSVPGPTGAMASSSGPQTSNLVVPVMTAAIFITQNAGPHSTLSNIVVERASPQPPDLYQLALPNVPEIDEGFTADNLVEGNEIFFETSAFPGSNQNRESGVAAPSSLRTTVRGNVVHAPSGIGVRDGSVASRAFPETCTLDSNRLCLTDADCFIAGIDSNSKGTCSVPFPPPQQAVDWSTQDFAIEGNFIEGPFTGGISIAANTVRVAGNAVLGPMMQGGLGGIVLRGKYALEGGSAITRNVVSGVSVALGLDNSFGLPASHFGAQVTLNDFSGYVTAVKTTNYNFPSELSVDGLGNYWGLSCEQGGFDPAAVDPPNPEIQDSHPYGQPVATTPAGELPPTCH